jgi:hypothetical protein
MLRSRNVPIVAVLTCMTALGCDHFEDGPPTPLSPTVELTLSSPAVPAPIEAVATPFGSVSLWPFTGVDVH